MCTVSWIQTVDGYELFCNRDELLTRKQALPAQLATVRGVQIIAPRDGDFGGSWISVNEFGLSLSLLNLYQTKIRLTGDCISRGLLLADLSDCVSFSQLMMRMSEIKMSRFQPFTMVVLVPGEPARVIKWDGGALATEHFADNHLPLTSSSFDTDKVIEMRRSNFRYSVELSGAIDSDFLLAFHSSHQPEAGAYSTCMHREDAATVSFSRIRVDSESVEFHYHPHSPCRAVSAEMDSEIRVLLKRKK